MITDCNKTTPSFVSSFHVRYTHFLWVHLSGCVWSPVVPFSASDKGHLDLDLNNDPGDPGRTIVKIKIVNDEGGEKNLRFMVCGANPRTTSTSIIL